MLEGRFLNDFATFSFAAGLNAGRRHIWLCLGHNQGQECIGSIRGNGEFIAAACPPTLATRPAATHLDPRQMRIRRVCTMFRSPPLFSLADVGGGVTLDPRIRRT